jgi:hypothetical protein
MMIMELMISLSSFVIRYELVLIDLLCPAATCKSHRSVPHPPIKRRCVVRFMMCCDRLTQAGSLLWPGCGAGVELHLSFSRLVWPCSYAANYGMSGGSFREAAYDRVYYDADQRYAD